MARSDHIVKIIIVLISSVARRHIEPNYPLYASISNLSTPAQFKKSKIFTTHAVGTAVGVAP